MCIRDRHRVKDIPVLVAGGGLKHGQTIFDQEHTRKSSDIWMTTLAAAGCETDHFADSKGVVDELLS